jgi:integrase/recombinase XerD
MNLSADVVHPDRFDERFDRAELAAAGYLARYGGTTRRNYQSDLLQWFRWCAEHHLGVLEVHRAQIEVWAREMEEVQHLARSTVGRRLATAAGFYRFAQIDGYIDANPAEHVRRPRVDSESTTLGLDRGELGAFIYCAEALGPTPHALACLLGLLGLRITEALNVDAEDFAEQRGHRTISIIGKGHKPALIPLPPRVSRSLDAALDGRTHGPVLLSSSGRRMDRNSAARLVRRISRRAGITKRITPHSLRHSFITAALDAGVPLRDVQIAARHADPRTTTRYDRARNNLDRHASYIVAAFIAGGT